MESNLIFVPVVNGQVRINSKSFAAYVIAKAEQAHIPQSDLSGDVTAGMLVELCAVINNLCETAWASKDKVAKMELDSWTYRLGICKGGEFARWSAAYRGLIPCVGAVKLSQHDKDAERLAKIMSTDAFKDEG